MRNCCQMGASETASVANEKDGKAKMLMQYTE